MATDIRAINLTIASALGLNTEHLVSATLTIKPDRVPEVVATYIVVDPSELIAAVGERGRAATSAEVAAAVEQSTKRAEARIREFFPAAVCPRCGSTSLTKSAFLSESFERWFCACGATGREAAEPGSPLVEVPPPVSARRSEPPQSTDLRCEGPQP